MRLPRLVLLVTALGLVTGCGTPPATEPCGPATCGGCCTSDGQCADGTQQAACGAQGQRCQSCGAGACEAQACRQTDPGPVDAGTGPTSGPFTVSGRVTYDFVPATFSAATQDGLLDFAQAVQRPGRNLDVQVLEGATVLGTGVTSEDGQYAISGTASGSAPIQVVVLARTSAPPIEVKDNTDQDRTWALGVPMPRGGGTVDVHATHGWTGMAYAANQRTAAPFAVLDAMYTAARAFLAERPLDFPPLTVFWSPNNQPASGSVSSGKIGTSFFSPQETAIYVLGKDGVDTDEYDDHVTVHEWGHYFEATQSKSQSPGGEHADGDVLDPRVAWSEGLGDAIPAMVLGRTLYVDTSFYQRQQTAWGFDAETPPSPTDDTSPGPFSEATTMRLLYDAFDSSNEGTADRLSIGLGGISDLLTGALTSTDALATVGAFAAGLRTAPGVSAAQTTTLLAAYSLGPITSGFGDGDPALRAMFMPAGPLPWTTTLNLDGRQSWNSRGQNQYAVLTGTGRTVTVTAQSTKDVGLEIWRQGDWESGADNTSSGTETVSFGSQLGVTYVVVVTGYASTTGTYPVTLSVKSP